MADEPTGKMSFDVTGTLLTEVVCPGCAYCFHLDGDANRVTVECPACDAELRVTRQ
jgi:hypothetical protein